MIERLQRNGITAGEMRVKAATEVGRYCKRKEESS